jgi:undecaprenyl diphosphate synthase
MSLAYEYLDENIIPKLADPDYPLSIRFIGDKSRLEPRLTEKCIEVERLSHGRPFLCNVAFNYGGRDEIVHAANDAIADGHTVITEKILSKYLYTAGTPDPELIIRTGGEMRLSNFLLWQAAYSELYVTDTLWPDFGREDVERALGAFGSRKRRFGGLNPEDEKEASNKQV